MPSSSAAFEANSSSALDSHWKERVAEGQREKAEQGRDREPEMRAFGTGGGPGWGAGQKKWRLAAGLAAPEAGDKVGDTASTENHWHSSSLSDHAHAQHPYDDGRKRL